MIEIIPAILPKNYEDLKNHIAFIKDTVDVVQVDICDGNFVKNLTWPFLARADDQELFLQNDFDDHFKKILNEIEGMPFWEDVDFELDLMVERAVENFDIYTKLGPKRIVFHIEAVGDLVEFENFLEGVDIYIRDSIEIGVAINIRTEIEKLFSIIKYIDFIQVMGIDHIGFQGADFDEKSIEHIKTLRQKFPELTISVDGGVNLKTAPSLIKAGANRLVIGSAIFKTDDIINTIDMFRNL